MKGLHILSLPLLAATAVATTPGNARLPELCPCGYRDDATRQVYTDSIVVYFNETEAIDHNIFRILEYEHKKEKGWNTVFRQGSQPSNVGLGNTGSLPWQDEVDGRTPSLELFVNPSTEKHLVNGAQLRSTRRDILYGTFRASLRSPLPWAGGSALTMSLAYNSSNSLELDMLNQDNASDAYVAQLINGESPSYSLGTNYTIMANGSKDIPALQPWDFVDVRFDWTNTSVDFWIGPNRTRSVTKDERTLPSVPQPLHFRHWSTGDVHFMQGPPINRSVANVRWVRAFFNSSLMTGDGHRSFDGKCNASLACSIDDHSLRGCTAYSAAATKPWVQPIVRSHIRWVAGVIAGCFSTFGVLSIINASIRRTPWHKLKQMGVVRKSERPPKRESLSGRLSMSHRHSVSTNIRQSLRQSVAHIRKSVVDAIHTPQPPEPESIPLVQPEGVSQQWNTSRRTSDSDISRYTSPPVSVKGLTPAPSYRSLAGHVKTVSDSTTHTITPLPSYYSLRAGHAGDASEATAVSDGLVVPDGLTRRSSTPAGPSDYTIRRSQKGSHSSFFPGDEEGLFRTKSRYAAGVGRLEKIHSISVDPLDDSIAPDQKPTFRVHSAEQETFEVQDLDQKTAHVEAMPSEGLPEPTSVREAMSTTMASVAKTAPGTAAPTQKIDHLAGFVALSCIGVTLRHFSLTFWPYVTQGYGDNRHFAADQWLAYILGPYILTPLWIGPFFVTSCRFLAARYLKNGQLSDVANKVLLRGPRMLIPCFIFMALEYFLLSLNLTAFLEWLPSVGYSTWPYVTPQPNFGVFFNEMVELSYLIPNAAPEVVNHYCVGVLWTIPVQHFYSYVTLLAAVMVRDVRKPWKRLLMYGLAIVAGWYATSWSACHWVGLLLADWDISYGMYKWIQAKSYRLYPIITAATLIAGATPLVLLFNADIFHFDFMGYENAIHPDPTTGRPILEASGVVYPDYNAPSLAVLVFSASLQVIVETSTCVQWFLSLRFFTMLHPHVMTIYLLHGFVFWSFGSWVAVTLVVAGLPYWAVLLLTALLCYTIILAAAFIISPMIEFATQSAMKNIWRWATEEPIPHRPTTAPFPKALIIDRGNQQEEQHEA